MGHMDVYYTLSRLLPPDCLCDISIVSGNADGISIRVASPKLVMEEAPESYKDVTQVL